MIMKYEQIQPPEYLQKYIRYFWTLESKDTVNGTKNFRVIADGCPGLIHQQPDKGTFSQNKKPLSETFLFGQATKHAEICLEGSFSTLGVFFYPHALNSVFGFNAAELTDSCLDLNAPAGKQELFLSEQLSGATSTAHKIDILSSYLFSQIRRNNFHQTPEMQHALSKIIHSKGSISLKQLQLELQLSERSFERKFKSYVGITPKLFSRICRFQTSLSQLKEKSYNKLSDIAFENDYTDQSHFIRSFKEFAGFSPNQYQKQSNEVAENLTELIQ